MDNEKLKEAAEKYVNQFAAFTPEYHNIHDFIAGANWQSKQRKVNDAVEFAEWIEDNYLRIEANGKWLTYERYGIYLKIDNHKQYLEEYSLTTAELYKIFQSHKK